MSMTLKKTGNLFLPGTRDRIISNETSLAIEDSTAYLLRQVKLVSPKSTGTLERNIKMKTTQLKGEVFSSLKYAVAVEKGHQIEKKGYPPPQEIRQWLLRPKKSIKLEGATIRQVVYLISRAIVKRGVSAKLMFEKGFEASSRYIVTRFRQAGIKMSDKLNR